MKYLKLFEDHKETSDKIDEIEKNAQKQKEEFKKQKEEVITQYKSIVDQMMYDITDYYDTTSIINITENNGVKTYIDYTIKLQLDKYEIVLDTLKEIVDRLKGYDVSYFFNGFIENHILDKDSSDRGYGPIPEMKNKKINNSIYPYDFIEAKKIIKSVIDKYKDKDNYPWNNGRGRIGDYKIYIKISF